MGNDLHGLAQVVAAPLFGNDGFVDAARRAVVVAEHADARKAFVVSQIKVGFGPVIGNENLAVLERAHGAGIDVQVGIKFQQRNS